MRLVFVKNRSNQEIDALNYFHDAKVNELMLFNFIFSQTLLNFTGTDTKSVKVEIVEVNGKRLIPKHTSITNADLVKIDLVGCNKDIYFVKIFSATENKTIVQKRLFNTRKKFSNKKRALFLRALFYINT